MTRKHAKLSPSAAERWLNCPGSIRMSENCENKESVYAAEGTCAHSVFEAYLRHALNPNQLVFETSMQDIRTDEHFSKEMEAYAREYVTYWLEQLALIRAAGYQYQYALEIEVNLDSWRIDIFGHVDFAFFYADCLHIVDTKYGAGIEVSAVNNAQLKLYAAGVLSTMHRNGMALPYIIRLTVWQPRLNNYSHWETTAQELFNWLETVVRPAIHNANSSNPTLCAGTHCKFCPAKGICATVATKMLGLVPKNGFVDLNMLSDEVIAEIVLLAGQFTSWIKAVGEAAQELAIKGKKFPGLKLVDSAGKRAYVNTEAIAKGLINGGSMPASEIYEPATIKPITALEKLITPEQYQKFVAPYVVREKGKPKLEAASSTKPEFKTIQSYFKKL